MVLALLYCLKNKIRFSISSNGANFSLEKGWNDFFQPFCSENQEEFNINYNVRPYQVIQNRKFSFLTRYYKFTRGITYLTQDIWDCHRVNGFSRELIHCPELGFDTVTVLEAAKVVVANTWKYNAECLAKIEAIKKSVLLPQEYVSIHVRSGDKFLENILYNTEQYMTVLQKNTDIREVFVLTDDYTILEVLKSQYSQWNFHTLCGLSERGYYHSEFIKQSKDYRFNQHLKLFASMDLCASSVLFIGTYSSNPGMYMGMRIGEENCRCLDFDSWVVW
jgi:hypothetical protein